MVKGQDRPNDDENLFTFLSLLLLNVRNTNPLIETEMLEKHDESDDELSLDRHQDADVREIIFKQVLFRHQVVPVILEVLWPDSSHFLQPEVGRLGAEVNLDVSILKILLVLVNKLVSFVVQV